MLERALLFASVTVALALVVAAIDTVMHADSIPSDTWFGSAQAQLEANNNGD
jgi:hypothetical protein